MDPGETRRPPDGAGGLALEKLRCCGAADGCADPAAADVLTLSCLGAEVAITVAWEVAYGRRRVGKGAASP